MPFAQLGLSSSITNNLAKLGYHSPTPIQQQAIPAALSGKNILASAQTGTGKTAAFVLPIIEQLKSIDQVRPKRAKAIIIAPTRELVSQVDKAIQQYCLGMNINTLAMYGGVASGPQKQALLKGIHILVATPGRLLDMYTQRAIRFDETQTLVLDEADKMLDMGFIDDINSVIEKLPDERQNLLFSATLSHQVKALAKSAMQKPLEISVVHQAEAKPDIEQWLTTVDKDKKSALLAHLIQTNQWPQALIFIETKHGAAKLVSQLEKRGIEAQAFHSGRSQAIREQLLAEFKSGDVKYIIATGVAARGIDIDGLPIVINYDLPFPADDYVHRIGRTGRAGAKGEAISFVSKDDFKNLIAIERKLNKLIERRVIEGFEPKKVVPDTVLDYVPKKPKQKPLQKTREEKPALSRGKSDAKPYKSTNKKQTISNRQEPHSSAPRKPTAVNKQGQNKPDTSQQAIPNGDGSFNPWKK